MKKLTKLFTILVAFCVAFTSLPMMAGDFESHALAKNVTLRVTDIEYYYTSLRWNTIKSPNNGYAVFRDGKAIAHLGKKRVTYFDNKLVFPTSESPIIIILNCSISFGFSILFFKLLFNLFFFE